MAEPPTLPTRLLWNLADALATLPRTSRSLVSSRRNRTMTTVMAGVTSVALLAVLGACGDDPAPDASDGDSPSPSVSASAEPSPTPTTSDAAASGDLPTVTGDFGEVPEVTVPDTDPPTDLMVEVLDEGKGRTVESGDVVVVNYLGARWEDGETFDSSFDRGPFGFGTGSGRVIPAWDSGLVGMKAGSRVLMVAPPDQAYGDQSPGGIIEPGDTLVFVIDIIGVHDASETAKGEPAPTEDDSLPYVSITPKEPQIVIPQGDPVNRLIAIPVVVGDGPKVKQGDTIVVQYKGVLWRNGKQFDASWGSQPFATSIGVGAVVSGWDKGLVGKTVGSRVMLVIPPKDGYGSTGSGAIKPTDTMVFAVDILAAY